jgi:hypothetical protein
MMAMKSYMKVPLLSKFENELYVFHKWQNTSKAEEQMYVKKKAQID